MTNRSVEHIRGLEPYRKLGAFLRETRIDRGLPAYQISKKLGISNSTWCRYETVRGCKRLDFCSALVVAGELNLDHLTVAELRKIVGV